MIPKQIDKKIIGLPDAGEKLIDTVNDLISYLQEREGEKCICPSPDEFYLKRCPVHSMSTSPQQTDEWEEEFDKEFPEGLSQDIDLDVIDQVKDFIRTHFIEKKKVREVLNAELDGLSRLYRQPHQTESERVNKIWTHKYICDLLSSLQLTEDEEVI